MTRQYKEDEILNYVKQCIPEKIIKELQTSNSQTGKMPHLKPLLQWFKNDYMKWMGKSISCETCKKPMSFKYIKGTSWMLRAIEHYSCPTCKSMTVFPRYGVIEEIADYRIGRCSEWSMLFGAILNSLSIETKIVHDFLDHCWNESLIGGKWVHVDSTLDYPISFNNPYHYEKNWGKKYSFVLSFSDTCVDDVTCSYSQELNNVQKKKSQAKVQ